MRTGTAALAACAALALCAALERVVAGHATVAPGVVERLVPPERTAGRTAAALSLRDADGERLYVRAKGLWRAREAYGAVCDTARVEAVVAALLDARGVEVCAGADCGARYGTAGAGALRVALHGPKVLSDPDGDTIAAAWYAPARPGATFASPEGSARVLDVDRDPRALLTAAGGAAPLVDRRVLAGCFAPGFSGFARVEVEREGERFALESAAPAQAEEQRRWDLVQPGGRREALLWRVGGYVSLWVRLTWDAVEDPRVAGGLGLDPPFARIALEPSSGDAFEVWVSRPDAANRVHVWNRATNVLMSVRADLLPLLVPDPADFTREEGGNPWERWLAPR